MCVCCSSPREMEKGRDYLTRQPGLLSEFQVKMTTCLKNQGFEVVWPPRTDAPPPTPTPTLPSECVRTKSVRLPEGLCFWPLHDFNLLIHSKWSNQKKKKNCNLKGKILRQNSKRISVFPPSLWEWLMIGLTLLPSDLFDPVCCWGTVCEAVFRQLKVTICF